MSGGWTIRARSLSKAYRLYDRPFDRLKELLSPSRARYHREVWALQDVGVEIEQGTVTGLVGVNGAGKSTFLKLIAGKLAPTRGEIEVRGRISSILELGTGFQPHLTGRQNALVNALFLGQRPWEAEARVPEVLAFADLGQYADQPLSTYSSGMQARLAFAVLTTLDPEVLVLDEALATGDAGFAAKCKAFLRGLCRSGCTTLVASHDFNFVNETCDRALWIDHGRIRDDGPALKVVRSYLDHFGQKDIDHAPRPRHVLLRIEAEDPSLKHAFIVHAFEWIGPAGEDVDYFYIGEDEVFEGCVVAATQVGLSFRSARAGWGPSQRLATMGGTYRACRPDLGPGGAVYLALPLPPAPKPLPARLRVAIQQKDEPTAAIISILANGYFHELARFQSCEDPWRRRDIDIGLPFPDEGEPAPPFDPATVARAGGTK